MNETINREDLYLFQTGKARQAYLTFGCHYQKKTKTHRFTVWAPNAKSVSVVGDFNFWNPLAHPMKGDKDGIYNDRFLSWWTDASPGGRPAGGQRRGERHPPAGANRRRR